jgi:hypothetical protein
MLNPINRFRAISERLRFRYMPTLARFCLNFSTMQARKKLQHEPTLRLLVDNTVRDIAVTHESQWISTGIKMWGGVHPTEAGYQARVCVHSAANESYRYRQSTYLTSIAHLARLGTIELCDSAELGVERARQPIGRFGGYGFFDYSLFSDIVIKSVDRNAFPKMWSSLMDSPSSAEQQRARLKAKDDELFHGLYALLKEQLGRKCDQDAWHICTAERYGLFCFLTTDTPLLKATKSLSKKEPLRSLKTKIMSPEDFAKHLGVLPVAPRLLSYNDASFFVRSGVAMPEERRRKRGEYK